MKRQPPHRMFQPRVSLTPVTRLLSVSSLTSTFAPFTERRLRHA
jgi:hypothetical protein